MIRNNILFRLGKMEIQRTSYVFILFAILFGGSKGQAQVSGANGPINWTGYMQVYNYANNTKEEGPDFGDLWGVSDLKTTVLPSDFNHKLQLFPNYNAYASADTNYWRNNGGAGPLGNKWMEASTVTVVSFNKLNLTNPLVFSGTINSNTLANGYTAKVFFKVFNNNYTVYYDNFYQAQTLTNGSFRISTDLSSIANNPTHKLQYGFSVEGPNANPANSNSLGKVDLTITEVPNGFAGPQLAVKIAGLSSSKNGTNQLPAPIIGKPQTYLIKLENNGNTNLVITNLVLSNTVANSFSLGSSPTNVTIAPSASLTIPLIAAPTTPAALAGVLTIINNDNDSADRNFRINLSSVPLQPIENFTNPATGLLGWSQFAGTPGNDPSANLQARSILSLTPDALSLAVNSSADGNSGIDRAPWWSGIQREVASPGSLDLTNSIFRISLRSSGGSTGLLNSWTSNNKNKVEVRLESLNTPGDAATGSLQLGIPIDDETHTITNGIVRSVNSGEPDQFYDRVAVELTNNSSSFVTAGGNLSALISSASTNSLSRAINGSIARISVPATNGTITPTAPLDLKAPFYRVVVVMTQGEFDYDADNLLEIDSIELQLATASKFELANSSFEEDSSAGTNARSFIPNGWKQWARTNGVNKELSSQQARTGTKSLRLAPQGDKYDHDTNLATATIWDNTWGSQKGVVYQEWPLPSPNLNLIPGASVHAQASVKVLSSDRLTGGSALNFGFRYLDSGNMPFKDDVVTVTSSNQVLDQWTVLTANSTIPDGAVAIQLVAEFVQSAATDAGSVFIDDLTVNQGSVTTPIPPVGYSLVWADEFSGSSLNSGNWVAEEGRGPNYDGWGNNESQTYTANNSNLRVQDGILILQAVKSGTNWTSARIKSQGLRSFKYGKIEFRAKLPTGIGPWPAAWLLGTNITSVNWPNCGEIDVMEWRAGYGGSTNDVNTVGHALHSTSAYGGTPTVPRSPYPSRSTVTNPSSAFHTYAVLWNSNNLVFSVDGVDKATLPPPPGDEDAFRKNFFIILNLAMGGNYVGGFIDDSLTQATYEVDYVRVYQSSSASVASDITPPAITLLGSNPALVNWGATYSDTGATAFDVGDNTSVSVLSNNPVNTAVPGSYLVTYTATDSSSNTATANRTVKVSMSNGGTNRGTDGLSDALRYAYGGTGTSPISTSLMPSNSISGSNLVLTYFARTNSNVTLTPVVSTDLSVTNSWTNSGVSNLLLSNITNNGTVLEKRQATTQVSGPKKFLKLNVLFTNP